MGTQYNITLVYSHSPSINTVALKQAVDKRLSDINASMSTYEENSELSVFNRAAIGECQAISEQFSDVLSQAQLIHQHSAGYFDITVGPLVNLWGFGPAGEVEQVPEQAAIDRLLASIGHDAFSLNQQILCKNRSVYIDLSAIAKGYAVDQIASLLEKHGHQNYLVEIGGEIRVAGVSARGDKWRLAVEKPESMLRSVEQLLAITHASIATSGDYRNFFMWNDSRYSHAINPFTGYPAQDDLASVTVIAQSSAQADAWATALLVMGFEQAQRIALKQHLAVFLIQRSKDNTFNHWHSEPFVQYLAEPGL